MNDFVVGAIYFGPGNFDVHPIKNEPLVIKEQQKADQWNPASVLPECTTTFGNFSYSDSVIIRMRDGFKAIGYVEYNAVNKQYTWWIANWNTPSQTDVTHLVSHWLILPRDPK